MNCEIRPTRTGSREIISVSIPVDVYTRLQHFITYYNVNRSAFISQAVDAYMSALSHHMPGGDDHGC